LANGGGGSQGGKRGGMGGLAVVHGLWLFGISNYRSGGHKYETTWTKIHPRMQGPRLDPDYQKNPRTRGKVHHQHHNAKITTRRIVKGLPGETRGKKKTKEYVTSQRTTKSVEGGKKRIYVC